MALNVKSKEIWKDVDGYEGLYKISNHGNLKVGGKIKSQFVDGRRRSRRMPKEELQLYHLEGVMRTQNQIRKLGYLP